jgi:hypothetical protein
MNIMQKIRTVEKEYTQMGCTFVETNLFKPAVDTFYELNDKLMLTEIRLKLYNELKNQIAQLRPLVDSGKITAEKYRTIIVNYGKYFKYAKKREEESSGGVEKKCQ